MMDIRVENDQPNAGAPVPDQQQPLLKPAPCTVAGKRSKTPAQKAVRKTFKGTAQLANLLPTGTVLIFQFLSPILTHGGHCASLSDRLLALVLLCFCAASCFLLCFTDSFRDARGKVRYGLATPRGMRVIDGHAGAGEALSPEAAAERRIRPVDVVHAVLSVLVFGAVALFDRKVVSCFCPAPSAEAKRLLVVVPVAVGVVCSALFLAFPSKRHGVGFPLSRN